MGVLRHRATARFDLIAPAGFEMLCALVDAASHLGEDLTITCGTDGHAATDPHTLGAAYDVSVRLFPPTFQQRLILYLRTALGSSFTVLYECPTMPTDPGLAAIAYVNPAATGVHCHLQLKNGMTYPPRPPAPVPTAVT